ncbi:hypothetical protein F2Q70_00004591 [Brassica cretica]|uniref:Uncharacterized protein n=1 Tax=Brassica cretica TaxID=69181 RepID=A0A8S9FXT6_BRACR|nr:hypothetical protein F2Q68_00021444 [Brassica cretica]KAF2574370.1 hypothetical protein F2Q70_00004591 [Brassica cretica]
MKAWPTKKPKILIIFPSRQVREENSNDEPNHLVTLSSLHRGNRSSDFKTNEELSGRSGLRSPSPAFTEHQARILIEHLVGYNKMKQQWMFLSLSTSASTLPTKITNSSTSKISGCGREEQSIISSRRHLLTRLLVRHFVNVTRAHQRAMWHWTSSSSFAFSRAAQVFANISSVYLFLTMRPLFLQSVMFSCRFLQKQRALLLASMPAAADSIFSRTKRDGNSETLPTRKLSLLCSISGDVFKIRNTKEPELDTQTQILSCLVMT